MDEIKLPPDVAHVVAEAISWMWGEGQTSGDDAAEEKLIAYLRANYPQLCQPWWDRERS